MIVSSMLLNFEIGGERVIWQCANLPLDRTIKTLSAIFLAARMGTLNINVSAVAEVSLHSCIPGVPELNRNFFLALLHVAKSRFAVIGSNYIFSRYDKEIRNSIPEISAFFDTFVKFEKYIIL